MGISGIHQCSSTHYSPFSVGYVVGIQVRTSMFSTRHRIHSIYNHNLATHQGLDPYQKFLYAVEHIHLTNKFTVTMAVVGIVFLFSARIIKKQLVKRGFKNAKYFPEVPRFLYLPFVLFCCSPYLFLDLSPFR